MRFKIGSVQNSAILEDSEYSEIENPYFSDNSSASQLTNQLNKLSKDFSRALDKSDNESSVRSLRSVGNKRDKRSTTNHSNLNEPIIEEEEEKEEHNVGRIISQTILRRRKANFHIQGDTFRPHK